MEPFIGMIGMFGFNFAPRLWSFCAGGVLAIAQQQTLFSLLGTTYGGDGRTTFALPDLRGRAPIGFGRHPGSLYDWRQGQIAGSESHTMTLNDLATHTHGATFTGTGGGGGGAAVTGTFEVSTDTGSTGTPSAGDYLAAAPSGGGKAAEIYSSTATGTVALSGLTISGGGGGGGITGGDVTVENAGAQKAFSLTQPVLVMNYSIAMDGIYPARS
jgi:microcystin-dependent protein